MARLRYLQNKRSGVAGTICKGLTDIYFRDDDMYIGPWEDGGLDMVADNNIWLFSDDIYFVGDVHYYGTIHETSTAEFDILLTDPIIGANAIHAVIDAGEAWTTDATSGGNLVAVRGKVDINGAGNAVVSATGVWAGVDFADAIGAKTGLVCALNAEVSSDNASKPNAIIYIQSLPGSGANFVDVPYIAFTETGSGTGSNILFSLGHAPAGTGANVTADTSGNVIYQQTLHIIANGSDAYIPYSTVAGQYTTAYPVDITVAAGTALDIGTSVIGIDFTGTYTTGAIRIGQAGASAIELAAYDDFNIASYTACDATSGTQRHNIFQGIMDGAGALGRVVYVQLVVDDVEAGAYVNAFKAQLEFDTSGSTTGLASVACLEFVSPGASTTNGTYAILELEMVATASLTSDRPFNYIWAELSGNDTAEAVIDGLCNLMTINNHTDSSGNMWYDNTLRIRITDTAWYLPMSSAQGSFTTAYPIVTTYGTIAIDISSTTTGIDITDASTAGININGTCATGITIGDGTTNGIVITGATNYAIDIQTTGRLRLGTGPDAPDNDDIGIPVDSTRPHTLEVYTEPTTAFTTTVNSFGIRSRYLITTEQTSAAEPVTITAVDARLRVKEALADGVFSGIQGTIEASGTDADFSGDSGTLRAAGSFTLDFDADVRLADDGWLCGVSIDSAVSDSMPVDACKFVALRISTGESSKLAWEHGIYMDSADVATGIEIVAPSSYGIVMSTADVPAISITETNASGGNSSIKVSSTFTAQNATAHRGIESDMTYTPATSGTAVPIAIAAKVTLAASQTHSGLYMWAIQGGIKFLGGSVIASSQIAAGRFVLEEADAVTYTSGNIAGIYVDNLITSPMADESSGLIDLIRIANHGGQMDNAIDVRGYNVTNLFYLVDADVSVGGFSDESATAGTMTHTVKCEIDGTDAYLHFYDE